MKKNIFIIIILFAEVALAGPIREGIVWEVEKKLVLVPSKLMIDKSKTMFLRHLHTEISDKDEAVILQTYTEISELLGLADPLGLIAYIKKEDAEAINKLGEQMMLDKKKQEEKTMEQDKAKPTKKMINNDLQDKLDKIKEAREYGEQLLKED